MYVVVHEHNTCTTTRSVYYTYIEYSILHIYIVQYTTPIYSTVYYTYI